jgi:transposase
MIVVLGIDLGKNLCSLVGLDAAGAVILRRRMRREGVVAFVAGLPPCLVAMEASCGAHHLGRQLVAQGREVRLMPPEYVRPYVKSHKNDDRDAEAIAEAATRPTMRFVALKTEAQLDLQILHRARERLVGRRTALINQLRATLLDRGVAVPQGKRALQRALPQILADPADTGLSGRIVALLTDMLAEWEELDRRVAAFDTEFLALAREDDAVRRLVAVPGFGPLTASALVAAFDTEFLALAREDDAVRRLVAVPGFGPLTASALVAAVGDARRFKRARDLGAWLGLAPRQATTGGRPRLLGISRRGDGYIRKMLIHGPRAALPGLAARETATGRWLRSLLERTHKNRVVVALAHKLARIAWAVLVREEAFEADRCAVPAG